MNGNSASYLARMLHNVEDRQTLRLRVTCTARSILVGAHDVSATEAIDRSNSASHTRALPFWHSTPMDPEQSTTQHTSVGGRAPRTGGTMLMRTSVVADAVSSTPAGARDKRGKGGADAAVTFTVGDMGSTGEETPVGGASEDEAMV